MFTNLQKGFGGGEIAPELWGKTDLPKYPISLKTCENFKVSRTGNVTKCPGTEMIARTPSDGIVRLFKFVLDNQSGFLLEMSDGLIRVFQNGKYWNPGSSTWNNTTTYSPGSLVTYNLNQYIAIYNKIENSGITPGTDITQWVEVNQPTYSVPCIYTRGSMNDSDFRKFLNEIKFRQVNGVMFFVHPDYPPIELVFDADMPGFYFKNVTQIPEIKSSGFRFIGSQGDAGSQEYDYKITIENMDTGEESFPIPTLLVGGQDEVWQLIPDSSWQTSYPTTGLISFTWNGIESSKFTHDITLNMMQSNPLPNAGFDQSFGHPGSIVLSQAGNDDGSLSPFDVFVDTKAPLVITFTGSQLGESHQTISSHVYTQFNNGLDAFNNPILLETQVGWHGDISINKVTFNTQYKYIEVTTSSNHGMNDGDQVLIYGTGINLMDDRVFNVLTLGLNPNVYRIYTDPTGYGTGTIEVSGYSMPTALKLTSISAPTMDSPVILSWSNKSGNPPDNYFPFQVMFNVYKGIGGVYGFIGSTQGYSFEDTGIPADIVYCPPDYNPIFLVPNDYPSCIESYQQRLCLAATNKNLLEFDASRTGFLENFTTRTNLQSDDAIIRQSLEADAGAKIKHLVNFGFLIVFTDQGEIVLKGDSTGVLTPVNINTTPQTYNGASDLRPLKINKAVLYCQAQTSLVRDMQVQITPYGYTYIASSDEITVMAKHLVEGHSIVDWDFQRIYDGTVWAVREDGIILGLTYCPEQQLSAWWRRTTQGVFENSCCITEGIEDVPYFVVKRTIAGIDYRFIERMSSEQWTNIEDSNFLDCSVKYDGRNTSDITMTLVPPVSGELWTLEASENYFPGDDPTGFYKHIKWFVYGPDGYLVKCTPLTFNSPTSLTVEVDRFVPDGSTSQSTDGIVYDNMQNTPLKDWSVALNIVYAPSPLWGCTDVAAMLDGKVVCNPLNESMTNVLPSITFNSQTWFLLPDFGEVIHVGFPYMSSLQTLDYDEPKDSYIDKITILKRLTCMVKSSQNFWVGTQLPESNGDNVTGSNTFELTESKLREHAGYDKVSDIITGRVLVDFSGNFEYGSGGVVRSIDPVPLTISAIGSTIDAKSMGK